MSDGDELIVVGEIVGPHGVRGELKMRATVDDPSFLHGIEYLFLVGRRGRTRYDIKKIRSHKKALLVTLDGVEDRTQAEGLRSREVAVPFEWLPPLEDDEFYVAEIVGLDVEDESGASLGRVEQVIFTGANEVYVVDHGPPGQFLLPAIESVIQEVDLERGAIVVRLPAGLLP